jgi:hypothetical protein
MLHSRSSDLQPLGGGGGGGDVGGGGGANELAERCVWEPEKVERGAGKKGTWPKGGTGGR